MDNTTDFKCTKCTLGPCSFSAPWDIEAMKGINTPLGYCPLGGEAEFKIITEEE